MSWLQQRDRLLSIETPLGEGKLILTNFACSEALSEEFSLSMTLMSQDVALTPQQMIGKSVTVKLHADSMAAPRFFNGIVSEFSAGPVHEGVRIYTAKAIPWLGLLGYNTDCRIFQHKTVVDIAKQLFQEFCFSDFDVSRLQGSYLPLDYCIQFHESTLNFLKRILAEAGIFYFFQHEANKHKLILADKPAALPFCSQAPVAYSNDSGKRGNFIKQWERGYQFYPGKAAHMDYDFEKPSQTLLEKQTKQAKLTAAQKYETYHYLGRYGSVQANQALTQQLFDAHESHHDIAYGAGNLSEFYCGGRFNLENAPVETDDDVYVLTHIKHWATDGSYKTSGEAAQAYSNTFSCIPAAAAYKPYPKFAKPIIYGPQTAVVVGPKGEEIYTDKYGRVKVHFHWIRNGSKDDKSSCWVRVAQSWAGRGFGTFFLPRMGEEVVVQFLDGDPDRPLIVGSVYNAAHMPPYNLPSEQTKSGIKTHSTKGGGSTDANELRFEDKVGSEEIYLHAQKDFNRQIENSETALIVKGDHSIKIAAGKSVLEASQSIELKVASNSIKLTPDAILINGARVLVNKS